MEIAAGLAVSLLSGIAVFQLALALGAPFGKAAWGGAHDGALPTRLRRVSAVVGVVVYPTVIAVVLSASGLIEADLVPGRGTVTIWMLATIFLLGAIANGVSRSRAERLWAPVSLTIALCCSAVAVSL
jgi:hypothetical protein